MARLLLILDGSNWPIPIKLATEAALALGAGALCMTGDTWEHDGADLRGDALVLRFRRAT